MALGEQKAEQFIKFALYSAPFSVYKETLAPFSPPLVRAQSVTRREDCKQGNNPIKKSTLCYTIIFILSRMLLLSSLGDWEKSIYSRSSQQLKHIDRRWSTSLAPHFRVQGTGYRQKKVKARLRDPASWLPLAMGASSCNLAFTLIDMSVYKWKLCTVHSKKSFSVHLLHIVRLPPILAGWWNMCSGQTETL